MSFIPIVSNTYPDELLYSWLQRLKKSNGLSNKSFYETYLGIKNANIASLPIDAVRFLNKLCEHFYRKISPKKLFLDTTTFGFESVFMTKEQQLRYINYAFQDNDELNPPINGLFRNLHICPKCVEEDREKYGEAYIHRKHNYSGIYICPDHHVKLLRFNGLPGHACDFNPEDYQEVVSDKEIVSLTFYADYACNIAESNINANIYSLKRILFDELKKHGYSAKDNYNSLIKDFYSWKYSELFDRELASFLKLKMINLKHVSPDELIPLLMFLFPNSNKLIPMIKTNEPIIDEYICPNCGNVYCTTPYAANNGWGCPKCSRTKTIEERFAVLVSMLGNGEYELVEKFKSLNTKVKIKHIKCGKVSTIKPRSFLFEGARCKCESIISFETAKEHVANIGNYELLKFNGSDKLCKIHSNDCGHSFYVRYMKFIKVPRCRVCFPKNMTTANLRKRIYDTTNGEYELVGEFVDQKTKIKVLHTTCGRITEYSPRYFHNGAVCPACNNYFNNKWEKMYAILVKYKAEIGNTNIPKRATYKGFNLGSWCQKQ